MICPLYLDLIDASSSLFRKGWPAGIRGQLSIDPNRPSRGLAKGDLKELIEEEQRKKRFIWGRHNEL